MKVNTPNMLRFLSTLAGATLLTPTTEASLEFVAMLPNGGNVPDTPAIGHPDGTGDSAATNAFGDAFAEAGNKWTTELCMADTDGDGQTNGQELGDPCCEWDMDTNPVVQWTDGVSHPDDATKTSDESLWANIVCGGSGATSESGTTEAVEGSSSSAGNSTASGSSSSKTSTTPTSTTAAPSSSSQNSSTPSTSSAPAPFNSIFITAAGTVAVAAFNLV
ncbi:hypothetical protein PHYSODRAFT_313717 [Phytophthora sojae]|uniref:Temptin Cys/Cys disulfide domain-containing protein n=1 Tax=Phytophthora sojae (strain P6497) TaxID=1094619 RepID=G4Z4S4_PHYSP|nr:hypothetical protein PHYSODRAFT_313717 [Phytophthora sojae]EGZ21611.1 hypothetical protein PHYSODRAFT_313717 [Phytophthora sojae]|eukprot:XP_009524328.1 hypothetical protein PHYSODRAFT_313717 [Phytophthora sojae]